MGHADKCIRLLERGNNTVDINFDQHTVDWINVHYPERNWFCCGPIGLSRMGISSDFIDLNRTPMAGSISTSAIDFCMEMDDNKKVYHKLSGSSLLEPEQMFWDITEDMFVSFIRLFCICIMEAHPEKNIYLYKLRGRLEYSKTKKVKAHWKLQCAFEDFPK